MLHDMCVCVWHYSFANVFRVEVEYIVGLPRGESVWMIKRRFVVPHTFRQTEINPLA
jgi:hypothetical protein